MTTLTPAEYTRLTRRTRNPILTDLEAKLNAALGLGEQGEIQNVLKKEFFHGHPADTTKILDETGDLLFYLAWLGDLYGFTLEEAMAFNVEKLRARYPEGFSVEASVNRSDGGSA